MMTISFAMNDDYFLCRDNTEYPLGEDLLFLLYVNLYDSMATPKEMFVESIDLNYSIVCSDSLYNVY